MAVTKSYSLQLVQYTDPANGPTTSEADATSLADGGFAVVGSHAGHTDLDIFDADLSGGGGGLNHPGTNSAIDQLANGNLVIVSQDADSILYSIRTLPGSSIVAPTDLGDTNSSNADVAALTGGNFVIVSQDYFSGTDFDIDVNIRDSAGGLVTNFSTDATMATDNDPSVAALDDGGFAVAWTRTVGGDTEIWYAVYEANGAVRKAAAIADNLGTVNRNVDVSSKSGGFVLVYEDNGWGTGTNDITLSEFDSAGTFQVFSNISNPNQVNDGSDDANPVVTRLANNFLVVGYENNLSSHTDDIVKLFDANSNTVLTSRNVSGGELVTDDVGDITIAGSQYGRINVFHTNLTDGDVDAETLVGLRTSTGDGANDVVVGDDFMDIMIGNGGNDSLSGGANADTQIGGKGIDTMLGGTGSDTLRIRQIDGPTTGEIINGGAAADRLLLQGDVILRNAIITSIEEVEFFGAAPHVAQFAGAQAGAGLSGILLVDGVAGITDLVRFAMGADTAINLSGWTFKDWTPGGPDNDTVRIIGDGDDESIRGTSQADLIDGGDGNNLIAGDLGSDLLSGGTAGGDIDRFRFDTALGPANIDRVTDFEISIDEIRLENAIFVGLANGNLAAAAFRIGAGAADASDHIIYNATTGALFFDQDGLGGAAQVRFATLDTGLALDNLDFFVT